METNSNTIHQAEIRNISSHEIQSIIRETHHSIDALLPKDDQSPARHTAFPMMGIIALFIALPITFIPLFAISERAVASQSQDETMVSFSHHTQNRIRGMHAAAPETTASGSATESGGILPSPKNNQSGSILLNDRTSSGTSVSSSSGAATNVTASGATYPHPDNRVGVYLSAASAGHEDFLESTMEDSGKAGATAIVFDVKSDRVLFDTDAAMARQLNLVSARLNIQSLIKIAKQRGFYTIARFVSISDAGFTAAKPETQLKDPKSNEIITPGYIDPANTEALQYNSEIICDLAKNGVSEINLDYIRFSTSNTYATAAFTPSEKADRVEAFVRMARETIDRCGPQTKLGISTFAILGWSFDVNVATLGQNVVRFAPLVDIISPMAYPSMFSQDAYYNPVGAAHSRMYTLVYKTMIGYQKLLGPEQSQKLRPWLQGYNITTKNVQDQIQATMDSGECGFTMWNANNNYGPVYKAMKVMTVPERCR